jgi:hypothetical protein
MENNLIDKISSKYIIKNIFSYLKVQKALEILKPTKKLQKRLNISLFHYQFILY